MPLVCYKLGDTMRPVSLAFFALPFLVIAACADAGTASPDDPAAQAGAGQGGASGAGASGAGQGGSAGMAAGAGGSQAGAGQAGAGQGGAAGSNAGSAGKGSAFGGAAGMAAGGDAGSAGSDSGGAAGSAFGGAAGDAGTGGTAGSAGSAAGSAGSAAGGGGASGAPAGWTCGAALYNTGGDKPACNCDCGIYDPDCDNPTSFMKGCDKGQTCAKDGTCQGDALFPPASWVCGSAYYAIGGPVPVCDCGCGAPDPDCSLYNPTMNLTKCGKGQTCGADGTCQGPILEVPAAWTCKASKFAEGSTSGTCDCDCGAYDPDCNDTNLTVVGCGYKQTCGKDGTCQGAIAPAPAGWTCGDATYSDGKLCHCEGCGMRDPDCDLDLPDNCGPDAFCGSLKNECIPSAI